MLGVRFVFSPLPEPRRLHQQTPGICLFRKGRRVLGIKATAIAKGKTIKTNGSRYAILLKPAAPRFPITRAPVIRVSHLLFLPNDRSSALLKNKKISQ